MADKPITVKAYGRIHTFPAGTPTEQIEATLAEHEHVLNPDYEQPSGASGLLGSVVRGAKGTGRLVSAGYDAFTGDRSGVDKTAATSNLAAERETPIEQGRLQFELNGIDREQGVMGQIGYTLKTAGRNPMGTAQLVAEQLPNSAVTLAGGYAGFKGGALAGAPFGPAGAAIGGAIGFLGGMFLGNTLIEAGSKGIQKASDKDGFTEQDKDDTIRESAIKGAVLTGVDAATLKLGSAIMKRLGSTAVREGAKAEAKVLMDAGVDMSSTTTINAALKSSPELFQAARLAGEKAAVGALSRSKKAGIVGTGLTMETAGEGVGEYAGEYAATGKADVVDATIEALSGATMSAAETAYNFNKLKAGNDLSAKGMMDSITPETLEGKRNDAMQKADVINKQQQQQDMADIGAATDIDQAIAATVSAVSRPAANANDILRAEDPTLADIERLTGLKPTHAIDAAIDEINNPIIDQPLEAENGNNQTSQQEATTKTPVLATNESIEKSTNGQAPAGTGGPERAGASRVVESPVPEVEDQGASAEALGPAEPVSAQKTNSDGSVWEVKYRTIKRSDGMVMVVREREGLNGAVTEHLNSNFDWVKGEPSAVVISSNKGRIIDGPELFISRDKAIENAMGVDETTITSTPTPAKQTKPPLGTDKLTDTSPVLSAEMFKASGKTGTSYAQYLKEHPNRKEAASVDLKNVEDTLVKSLQKTGKFTATDSKTYAKKFTEFYKVNAERQGILPSELYERMPLKFNGTKSQRLSQDAKVTPASRNKQNFDLKDATPEDFTPDNVGSLINRKNWAIMTAANPQGKSQDDAKNLEANKKLQKELADKGLAFEVVKGMYPGDKSEMESYLVYGIDQKAANELGNKYGQDSVLTREGLVHQSGKVTPVKAVGKGTPDGYTKVPRTGARFAFDMDWDREASVGDGALSVVARHYSKAPRKALEGSRFGEGYKGEERERIAESDDPRLKSRVDFYVDTGEGVTPETGLGEHIHEKLLHNIYDASTNPKRFKFPSNWLGANTFEKQVLDAGYDGYFTRQGKQGRVVVLGDAAKSIPIEDNNEQSGESELLSQSEGTDTSSRESDGSLQGLPRQVGQFNAALHKKAEKVARDYMKSAGLEYNPPNTYANVNVERAERIATAFDAMKHDPQNPEVKAAYDALVKETTAQYKAVVDSGLKVEFIDFAKTGDPYKGNPRAMTEDVRKNNHMWVFSTREGFGSSDFDPADNPLLAETEFEISGQKALANDLFRVVHDYFGHVKEGVGFRAAGEENAWRAHMAMFSPLAGRALTTETRGQNSWVNYGPFAEFNKTASGADTKYADQKIGLLPEWASTEGRSDEEYNQSAPTALFSENNRLTKLDRKGAMWSAVIKENPSLRYVKDRVNIFRATTGSSIRVNDFVALNKKVAEQHLENLKDRGETGKIISQQVSLSDLLMANDATEFVYYPEGSNILHQSNFYSALEKEIGNLKKIANKNGEVSVEQAKAWINSRQKEGKFKQAEVEAVGLLDWLDTLEGKVPVTDVEKFVQENGVQVEEVVLEGDGGVELDEDKVYDEAYQDFVDGYELPEDAFDDAIKEVADEMLADHNADQWYVLLGLNEEEVADWLDEAELSGSPRGLANLLKDRYQPERILGEDEYNEVRDAQEQDDWESNQDYYMDQAREQLMNEAGGGSGGTEFEQYVLRGGGAEYKELLLTLPNAKAKFNAPHFDKAQDDGAENIFAHTRINERYVDVPLSEEQLADYQEAKAKYETAKVEYNERVSELNKQAEPLLAEKKRTATEYDLLLRELSKETDKNIVELLRDPPKELVEAGKANERASSAVRELSEKLPKKPEEPRKPAGVKERVLFVEEIQSDWAQRGRDEGFGERNVTRYEVLLNGEHWLDFNTKAEAVEASKAAKNSDTVEVKEVVTGRLRGIPTAPFVTDTKAWTGLVAKRLLRYAAENGFDRIAWTAGAQQAERYRLSKFVDRVTANRSDDGKYYVKAVTEDGKTVAADFYEADKLAGTFGKELADKIISQPEGEQVYSGLDLDVGGSGMKEFYDRIVPSVFNDISRKLGGDKVETISMGGQSGKVVTGLEGRIVITYPNGSYLKNRNTGVMTESQDRADRFDSKEEATKFLDKFESQNLHDVGRQMSLKITPDLKEKVMQGLPLFQRDRAGYNPNTFTISLMEGSDMTSVIHEGGHFYLEALADMASRPGAPEQIVKDFDTTLDWFGVTKEDWKTMTLEQKRPHHEQWAQSFELYAMEGVAPTEEMQSVFDRFKEWMLETYKSLKEFLKNNPLAGRLNNDVRQVFDRLLASENDIAATAAARGSLKQSGKQTPLRIYDKSLSQFAAAVARRLGAKPSGRSKGSRYYTLPDGSELRISDHEFPRGHGGGVAEVDIIYNKEDYGVDVFRNDVKTGIKTKEVSYRSLNLNGSDMGGLEGFNGDTQAWEEAVTGAIKEAARASTLSQAGGPTRAAAKKAGSTPPAAGTPSPKTGSTPPAAGAPTPKTGSTPPAKPFNPNEDIPETRFRKAQRLTQDAFNRFTVIKEWLAKHGTVLSEKADVFQAEERYNSLVANQLEDFREQQRNPLIEKITKAGFTLSDVADFLEAQHAEEANKAIQEIRGEPDATAYGVTDEEAKAYLDKADPELKKLANELRDITEQSKQMRLDAGLLSQDEVDAWEASYKFYIPVKGDADAKGGTGKGLKVNFKSKRRLGHGKRDEAVVENIFLDHEKAIMQVEKNRVAKHLVMMAAEMNRPEIVSIGQPVKRNVLRNKVAYEVQVDGVTRSVFTTQQAADMFKQLLPTIDKSVKTGSVTVERTNDQRVIGMASPMLAENEINAYIDGHAIRVQINDDLLARAYGKLGVTGFSALVSAGRAFNGYLSKVYTGYNPEFILTNMIRDFTSGLINLTGEEGGKIAAKAAANYVKSFSSLMKYAISNGKKSDKWIDMYRANGGNTGAAYLSDLERLGDEIKTEYASYQGVLANLKSGDIANASRAAGRKVFNITLKWIYNLNQAGENAMRLAAFRAMIESGKTPNQAAKASKNITVNFNRKGELGAEANAAYLFFNASVQGTAALAHAHFKGKHKAQAWGLSATMSALGYLAAVALMGDDEDDYDKINDYTKSRNLLIKAGEGYVQIPVPYGYGFFWNTGRAIAEAQHKGELGVLPWHMAASAIEELTPFSDTVVGSQDGFHFDQVLLGMLPTVVKIPAQPAFNKQLFSGGELFPERASQQFQPDREKLWRSTQGTMYDKMAGWLSDANVGDVTPETLKHYTRTFTGGTGALVDATISAAMLKKEGAELEPSEIPFVRKAYSKLTIRENRAAYYKAREEAKKTAEAFSRAKTRNDVTTIDKLVKDEGEMLGLDAYANSLSEAIGAVRDLQDAIRVDDSLNAAEKRVQIKELEITEQKFYDQYLDVFKIEKMKMKSRKD